jgi:hypothetical protein
LQVISEGIQDRGHRSDASGHGFLHRFAPASHQVNRAREVKLTSRYYGRVFTKAMTGKQCGFDPGLCLQGTPYSDAYSEYTGLSVCSEFKLIIRAVETQAPDIELSCVFSLFEGGFYGGKLSE